MDKKIWNISMMEYYLAIKRKEVLIYAAIWMNLEYIMLSERSHSHMTTYFMIQFL